MSTSRADKLVDNQFAKWFVIVCGLVPAVLLVWDAFQHQLGVNDVNFAIRTTGLLGIVFLSLSILITPLRRLTGWSTLLAVRRNLGVFGFFYIASHFAIFFWWDRDASIGSTIEEIVERVYLWFGTAALVLMIPLTITSTDGMVTRLGAKRWKRLHRLAYLVVAGGLVHYWLLVKADTTKPLVFTIVFGVLMALRLVPAKKPVRAPQKKRFWRGVLKIGSIVDETHDAKTFRFVNPEGGPIPFEHIAGQYLTVTFSVDGKKANRSYTIASPPTRRDYVEITVKRNDAGNGGSSWIHKNFHVGELVAIGAPAGKFHFAGGPTDTKRIVLLAGGVGITPAMSVIRSLTDRGWDGDMYLAYAVRTERDVIFAEEIAALQAKHPKLHVKIVFSRAQGHITAEMLRAFVPDIARSHVMMCGPTPMMVAMRRLLVDELRLPNESVHEEIFTSTPITAASASEPAVQEADPDATFGVHFRRAEKRASIVGLTILEAAEDCGIDIPNECRSGICGQCKTKLVSGTVAMDVQDALTPADRQKGLVLACQARPTNDLVIDA